MRARAAAALVLAALVRAASAADDKTVPLVLRLSERADAIWSALPSDGADPRVTRVGDAPVECVSSALAEARRLLGQSPDARAALRDVSMDLRVPRTVIERLARGEGTPSMLAPYVTPETRGPQVAQPLGDATCGAYYELRGAPGAPGTLALAWQLEAGCGCTQKGVRVHLRALAPLAPDVMERKDVLRLRAGEARYEVLASCDPCAAAAPASGPRVPVPGGPCDNLCAPLAQGLAAWQHKVTETASRLEQLAGQATTLQLQVSTDRRELADAAARRSKPRAVLERISALQARIKSAEADLARVRQASLDVERTLSALRRVTGDTEGAEGRCRAQCQARPPRPQQASAEAGSSGASGGGISTGVLVAGGVALAAGGAVALAAGGGSDTPAAPLDISGLWRGTNVVTSGGSGPEGCVRTFAEDWQIAQNGTDLDVAVQLVISDCGPQVSCQSGCVDGAVGSRRYTGTLSGSMALLYPYPTLHRPDCILAMAIQGSAMRGTMPACGTQRMDAVMQRVTR